MWHSGIRVIQDPVHGLMKFIRSEAFVLDLLRCAEMQRLRRIKQLGLGCFVFPGAEHSRFSHAVGTAYLAAQVGRHLDSVARETLPESLRPDPHSLQDLCVAGLCHDLGHGPFSHVWERVVIGEHWDRAGWARKFGIDSEDVSVDSFGNWHEMVTYAMLTSTGGQLNTILEQNALGSARRTAGMLVKDYYLPYLPALISSDIDVDRLDYLLRDARMAGLPSCGFQLDRLIASLTFGFDTHDACRIGLNLEKGLPVAIELLNARAELYEVLYYHRTILGMEWLLGNLFTRLRDLTKEGLELGTAGAVPRPVLDMLRGDPISLEGIMELDDYAIWMLLAKIKEVTKGDPTAAAIAKRLLERDPLRAVRIEGREVHAFFEREPLASHEAVRSTVGKFVEGDPHYFYKEVTMSLRLWEGHQSSKAHLILQGRPGKASFLSEHPRLRELFPQPERSLGAKLLVPREALSAVEDLIRR